jgi:hypothetical protein
MEFIIYFWGLAINDVVEREWRNTTGDEFFDIWFDEQLVTQK